MIWLGHGFAHMAGKQYFYLVPIFVPFFKRKTKNSRDGVDEEPDRAGERLY